MKIKTTGYNLTFQSDYYQKDKRQQMWRVWNPCTLLVSTVSWERRQTSITLKIYKESQTLTGW